MRIGCLQFAPQVGDIDNNLNRADSVLAKANQDDLDTLDLLVLPELAFTGYNFKSLQHISPYLEPSGSGISSLWARTTALKYNTNVIVGYPEKVDVSPQWPTGPEYYNSAIIVNGDGETIANYRKSFLYAVDETWALEGKHGFYNGYIPALGHTTMGICMDLNPYKFEAPWHAFEFAFHVLEMQSNLVIVTMSWLTREDSRLFTRMPAEPDMETLTYWVQRLEPIIRAESEEEVIVVFCNRTGMEDDVVYAGTSAVIGIKDGEVNVYGLLGRGVKELLVVDTDNGPYAKLLHRPEGETTEVSGSTTADVEPGSHSGDKAGQPPPDKAKSDDAGPSPQSPSDHTSTSPQESTARQRREMPPSPKISIPTEGYRRQHSTQRSATIEESPIVETPTAPSPTPLSLRPKLFIPGSRPANEHVDTPYPGLEPRGEHNAPNSASDDIDPSSEKYFWVPSSTLLQTPLEPNWPRFGPESPTVASSLVRVPANSRRTPSAGGKRSSSPKSVRSSNSAKSRKSSKSHASSNKSQSSSSKPKDEPNDSAPPRPYSPKSRNASRSGRHTNRAGSDPDIADIAAIAERLEALNRRPGSAMDSQTPGQGPHERPRSPKSRNASRSGRPIDFPYPGVEERVTNLSRSSIPIGASPSIFLGTAERPPSSNFNRPSAPIPPMRSETARLVSQNGHYGHIRPESGSGSAPPHGTSGTSPGRPGDQSTAHIEPDETRTVIWDEINKLVGEVMMNRSTSRSASRGRQPGSQRSQSGAPGSRVARSESQGYSHNEAAAQNVPHDDSVVPIRTVTLGNGPSQGALETIDPDEIVAEIIFHPRGYSVHNHGTPSNSSTTGTPNQGANGVPPQRRNSARAQDGSRVGQRNVSPPPRTSSIPGRRKGDEELSSRVSSAEISIFKAPTPLRTDATTDVNTDATTDSLVSLPPMSGSSVLTMTTPNDSPSTPPPRLFEPTTPKAMKLDTDFGNEILSALSEPTASGTFPTLHRIGNNLAALGPDRPKSAVW